MNKRKKEKRRGLRTLAFAIAAIIAFASVSFAIQLNVDFVVSDSVIKTLGAYPSSTLTTMSEGTGTVRILKGSPLAPRAAGTEDPGNPVATYSGGNITGLVGDGPGGAGSYYFAHSTVNVDNGNAFFVRTWNGSVYIDCQPVQSISWGDSPLPNYTLNYTSSIAYWARQPEAPSIASISESLQRNDKGTTNPDDDTYDLTLTVTPSYNESTTHIQLAQTDATGPDGAHSKFRLHCYKTSDSTPPNLTTPLTDPRVKETNGGGVSFSGGNGYFTPGTYRIEVYAFNWFGHGSYTAPDYATLSRGAGPLSYTLTLESGVSVGKPGINFFAMPFAGPWYVFDPTTNSPISFTNYNNIQTNEVVTAYDLVKTVNTATGQNVVSTFGRWDKTKNVQADIGILILGRDPNSTSTEPGQSSNVVTRLKNTFLQQGEGYQVYITNLPVSKDPLRIKIWNTASP